MAEQQQQQEAEPAAGQAEQQARAAPAAQQRSVKDDYILVRGGSVPAAKRRRTAPAALTTAYEPRDSIDLIIRCADGKRLGCHRLIVLRSCRFFDSLLDACFDGAGEPEAEVAVTELHDQIKPHLLDLLYNRAVQIRPETVMQVGGGGGVAGWQRRQGWRGRARHAGRNLPASVARVAGF